MGKSLIHHAECGFLTFGWDGKPHVRSVLSTSLHEDGTEMKIGRNDSARVAAGRNTRYDEPSFFEKAIVYCHEFCDLFPDSDELLLINMKRMEAESHFGFGRGAEVDRLFQALIDRFPENGAATSAGLTCMVGR